MKTLACRDLGKNCDFVTCNKNEEGLMKDVTEHAKKVHGLEITPELKAEVKAAIKSCPLTSCISKRLEDLMEKINSAIKPGMDPELQTSLGRILDLVPGLEKFGDMILIELAVTATSALLGNSQNYEVAEKIISRIQGNRHGRCHQAHD